jgi:hypothetical protein
VIQWQKATFSSGSDGANCVEVAASEGGVLLRESDDPGQILRVAPSSLAAVVQWQKSSYSGGTAGNECVELAHADATLLLRESDAPDRILMVSPSSLAALLRQL